MEKITYEIANQIVVEIPDDCRSTFWKLFDDAQRGDNTSIRVFEIFISLYSKN